MNIEQGISNDEVDHNFNLKERWRLAGNSKYKDVTNDSNR